jgi:hypothetical protein
MRRRRCLAIAGAVLAAGWAVAIAVYATAEPVVTSPELEEVRLSKAYQRQMELVGGKAAVAAAQLDEWLASLWHGERLAGTIAVLTVALALACWAVCATPPRGGPPGAPPRSD